MCKLCTTVEDYEARHQITTCSDEPEKTIKLSQSQLTKLNDYVAKGYTASSIAMWLRIPVSMVTGHLQHALRDPAIGAKRQKAILKRYQCKKSIGG